MKNVLITGATGAIGQELIQNFLNSDTPVVIHALVRNEKKARKLLPNDARIRLIVADITHSELVEEACKDKDIVFHLAAVIPTKSIGSGEKSKQINIEGTRNIVNGLTKHSPGAYLFFSSSVAIYGDRIQHPMIHVDDPLAYHDDDDYSTSKHLSEKLIQESNLNWSIFRLTAIMGIGNHQLNPLVFNVPLETKMEIATVKDTARAFYKASHHLPELNHRIFNLGGGEKCRITYQEFMQKAFESFGLGDVNFPPYCFAEKGFHCGYFLDSDVLENILHFQQDSIETYFDAFRSSVPAIQRLLTKPFAGIVKRYLRTLSEPLKAHRKDDIEKMKQFF